MGKSFDRPDPEPREAIPYLQWFDMSMDTLLGTEIGGGTEVEVRAILHYGYGRENCICRFTYMGIPLCEYQYHVDCGELYCEDLPDVPGAGRYPVSGYPKKLQFESINEFVNYCMRDYHNLIMPTDQRVTS
jgi:hypothetical protein